METHETKILKDPDINNRQNNRSKFGNSKNLNTSNSNTYPLNIIDVKFKNEPFEKNASEKSERKRKRQETLEHEHRLETVAEEEYNRELHEQRYKRLMHLLNKSQFYASYLIKKIDHTEEKENHKQKKKEKMKSIKKEEGENVPPQRSKKNIKLTQKYDIQDYISTNEEGKLHATRKKLNLSEEDIERELSTDSDTEINQTNYLTSDTPKYFNGELREYQKEGLQWLKVLYENGLNGILADEMGLGKTIQVIALICHLIEKRQDGPYLIIAPLSTIPNWMIEFENFAPKIPVVMYHGPEVKRESLHDKIRKKYDIEDNYKTQPVILTSFEVPLTASKFLRTQKWRYIIIDEGHRIKNSECMLVKALKMYKSMNRLLLTGTPLQNNLAELWSLLNFLLPEIFDDLAVFESWFNVKDLEYDEGTEKFLKQEEEKHIMSSLREILKPFMLRREKQEVCVDIPPKKELIVYAPITELQHDLYKAVLNYDLERLSKIEDSPVVTTENGERPRRKCSLKSKYGSHNFSQEMSSILSYYSNDDSTDSDNWKQAMSDETKNLYMWKQYTDITERNRDFFIRIRVQNRASMYKKIVNHPYLVHCPLDPTGLPKIDDDLIKASGKLLVLDAMLAKLKAQGHKVLLFSTMTMILDMIEDYLSMRNYRYVRLDGTVAIEQRKEDIKNFNSDPNIFLFLISTRAGGVGLNLASADTVIMYDSDWNPQADIQAMARCHRIGQTRPVVIYKLCTKGTIDEAIMNRADAKRILEKMVISKKAHSRNFNNKNSLNELKLLLESKECQVVKSENEEEELNRLLDRSDLLQTVLKTEVP